MHSLLHSPHVLMLQHSFVCFISQCSNIHIPVIRSNLPSADDPFLCCWCGFMPFRNSCFSPLQCFYGLGWISVCHLKVCKEEPDSPTYIKTFWRLNTTTYVKFPIHMLNTSLTFPYCKNVSRQMFCQAIPCTGNKILPYLWLNFELSCHGK